jgi:hypothetical protein
MSLKKIKNNYFFPLAIFNKSISFFVPRYLFLKNQYKNPIIKRTIIHPIIFPVELSFASLHSPKQQTLSFACFVTPEHSKSQINTSSSQQVADVVDTSPSDGT